MRIAKCLGIVMVSLLIGSCTTPMRQAGVQMIPYDRDTEYSITPRESDFAIAIYYSRYQFIPESNAVAVACKSALTSIAYEHAGETREEDSTNQRAAYSHLHGT